MMPFNAAKYLDNGQPHGTLLVPDPGLEEFDNNVMQQLSGPDNPSFLWMGENRIPRVLT